MNNPLFERFERLHTYEIDLPIDFERKIMAINVPQALEDFPDGIIHNINALKNKRARDGDPFTAFDLTNMMLETVRLVEKSGVSEETALAAHKLLPKYLDITVTNRSVKLEIAEFIRETFRYMLGQ